MNPTIRAFTVQQIKDALAKLPDAWNMTFRYMYGRNGGRRSMTDTEAMTLDAVVAEIPDEKLDWALTQVQNSLARLAKQGEVV